MNFTEKEFDLMIEALECLPNKDDAGTMISGLMGAMLCRDENKEKMESMIAQREKEHAEQKRRIKEDTTILIAKLLQLKREAVQRDE